MNVQIVVNTALERARLFIDATLIQEVESYEWDVLVDILGEKLREKNTGVELSYQDVEGFEDNGSWPVDQR